MLSSISDPAVSAALDAARKHKLTPSPDDWRDHWIYFLLIDRFRNPNAPPRHRPYNAEFSEFQGGTFRGVTEKLPCLKELGVGALWLSPVLKNISSDTYSYHGYGVQNFLEIEPRLASDPDRADDELRELVAEAHRLGMYVILDIVLHHAGNVFSYVTSSGEEAHEMDWQDSVQAIKWRSGGIQPSELQRDEFWTRRGAGESTEHGFHPNGDFSSLKAFDADFTGADGDKPIWEILIKVHEYLIARFDIDGFRIDTLKFLSPEFAHAFGAAIHDFARSAGKANFFLFGEIYDSEETISQFIGYGPAGKHSRIGINSALDYPLFAVLPKLAKSLPGADPAALAAVYAKRAEVEKSALAGHGEHGEYFVTFLDNHDQNQRFGDTGRTLHPAQIALGLALLFTLQGIPCVYYGTEQGLRGHKTKTRMDDSRVREALWGKPKAFSARSPQFQTIQALSALRRDHPALRCGGQFFRPVSSASVLAYARILEREEILVAANADTAEAFRGDVSVDWDRSPVGTRWRVLWSNLADPPAPDAVAERAGGTPRRVLPLSLRPGEVQILGV